MDFPASSAGNFRRPGLMEGKLSVIGGGGKAAENERVHDGFMAVVVGTYLEGSERNISKSRR